MMDTLIEKIVYLSFVILFCILSLAPYSLVQAQAAEEIDPAFLMDGKNVNPGDSFDVPIYFSTNQQIRALQFDLNFNPAVLQVTGIDEGNFISDFASANGASTIFRVSSIDNTGGKISRIWIYMNGAPGKGATGWGTAATVHFRALSVHAKSVNSITNYMVLDQNNGDLAGYTTVFGGQVMVGPGPLIHIDEIKFKPTGSGGDFAKTFKLQIVIRNIDGITSDPAVATITALSASPGFIQVPVPSIDPDTSVTIEVPQEYSIGASPTMGQISTINVAVSGDGSLSAEYKYQPIFDMKGVDVDGTVEPFIVLNTTALVSWPDLQLGQNNSDGTINVVCNTSYQVGITDNNPTSWHLTEWNGSSYLTRKLLDPLHVVQSAQGRDVSFGTPGTILIGQVSDQTADSGRDYPVTYQQWRHKNDAALSSGRSYHLVLTLTGYVSF